MNKLAKVEVMLPKKVAQKLDALLVFDARMVDHDTRQELLRILPRLINFKLAWRAHFQKYGCFTCPKPDPTVAIAAKLRQRRMAWAKIYEVVGIDRAAAIERKHFRQHVCWRLAHPHEVVGKRKQERYHLAGGFCDLCYARLARRMSKTLRAIHEGRDAKTETAALTQRIDLAQQLLNGDE